MTALTTMVAKTILQRATKMVNARLRGFTWIVMSPALLGLAPLALLWNAEVFVRAVNKQAGGLLPQAAADAFCRDLRAAAFRHPAPAATAGLVLWAAGTLALRRAGVGAVNAADRCTAHRPATSDQPPPPPALPAPPPPPAGPMTAAAAAALAGSVLVHAAVYGPVVLLLAAINSRTHFAPPWSAIVALSWGAGLTGHAALAHVLLAAFHGRGLRACARLLWR